MEEQLQEFKQSPDAKRAKSSQEKPIILVQEKRGSVLDELCHNSFTNVGTFFGQNKEQISIPLAVVN